MPLETTGLSVLGAGTGAYGYPWSQPSPLGASARSAVVLLMSTYDTDPLSTDQTAAFSAALLAASLLVALGVSLVDIILDSRQKYTIGGAVQSGANGQLAQVPLPFHNDTATGTARLVGIPRGNDYTYISAGQSGTVIESTLASAPTFSATTGIASIFGGPASFRTTPGTYPSEFSYLKFATKDITIRSASPVVCGIDAGWITGFSFDGLLSFDTDYLATNGIAYAGMTVCTAPQAIPIIFPFNLDWFGSTGDALVVAGWAYGPMLGEYLRARAVTVFATNCAILVDAANQASRIEYLTDWNNAYGVAAVDGLFTGVTPVSPHTTAPGSKRAYQSAITSGLTASPISVGMWEIQVSQGGSMPAATQRVHDILDSNALMVIDGTFAATDDAGNVCVFGSSYWSGGNLNIVGSGGSTTGAVVRIRAKNNNTDIGPQLITAPASGTVIRNPLGRDCLIQASNPSGANPAAITQYNVNGQALNTNAGNSVCLVPAQGTFAVTYSSGAPALAWTAV